MFFNLPKWFAASLFLIFSLSPLSLYGWVLQLVGLVFELIGSLSLSSSLALPTSFNNLYPKCVYLYWRSAEQIVCLSLIFIVSIAVTGWITTVSPRM